MKKLKISLLFDNVHFLFILVILLILSLKHWYFIPILLFFSFFIYKKTSLFCLCIILSFLICVSRYLFEFNDTNFTGIVVECDNKKALVQTNKGKVLIYHSKNLNLGDFGVFEVSQLDYDTELFDYGDYLKNKDIKNYFKLNNFEYKDNYFVISKTRDFFLKSVENDNPSKYKNYINMLVFVYKDEIDIKEEAMNLGISHLLAVSGMHISLLIIFLEGILRKLFYFEKPIDLIVFIFLVFYLVVTNFELTVLRASLMVLFRKLFKYLKLQFTSLDILSIVGILMLLICPRYLFLLSFQLSFIVSFIIIIFAKNFEIKNKIIQTYMISFVAFLVTLPFIINTNYEINLLSIIVGPLYVLYFELVLYPTTLIMFIFPNIFFLTDYFYNFFESTIVLFDSLKCFVLLFGKLSALSLVLYEIILYFLLVSFEIKRGRLLLTISMLIFLILLYNKAFFNPFYKIKMYDVGQGDSILLTLPHGEGNILFDCYNDIALHLKKDGIKKVDIVFLSHGHSDHVDAYMDIANYYKIKYTYSSYYDDTELLDKFKKEYEITLLKSGDKIIYKDFVCEALGPIKSYVNENNNSLVLKVAVDDMTILFTGDIEKEAELDLINKYQKELKCDVLKAAHHGSMTSSCEMFLNLVSPKYTLISVGRNNLYNFPNNTLLLALKNVYRTDIDNSITIYKRKKLFYIEK